MPDYDETEQDLHIRTRTATACPPLDMLLAAGQDVLPAEAEQKIAAHLQTCGLCQSLVKDLAELPEPELSVLQSARIRATIPRDQELPATVRRNDYRAAYAIAAMALFAASGFFGYRLLHHPAQAPAPPVIATVETPKALAPLEKLAPPNMALGMTSRGDHHTDSPTADELLPAFQAYNHGDYTTAQTKFSSLAKEFPASDLPVLYLGVTDLFLNQNQNAVDALSKAVSHAAPSRSETIAWYRAIAAQRTNDPAAPAMFAAICTRQGPHASAACLYK